MTDCFHCGLPVPKGLDLHVEINGQRQPMCCPGCQAVATAIVDGGLENFYRFRSENNLRPNDRDDAFVIYDDLTIQSTFVTRDSEGVTARLLLDGITCAACVWLIEKHLSQISGVGEIKVNGTTHSLQIQWDEQKLPLSKVMRECRRIGYEPRPDTEQERRQAHRLQKRRSLQRIAIAGFAMMQVGMVSIALYAGGEQSLSAYWQGFLRWLSLAFATPVILFSARPFFLSAWRSLKRGHLVMDVPVSLALILAYIASVFATVTNQGDVYFESVTMFTFFLLVGRFIEQQARQRTIEGRGLQELIPLSANRKMPDGSVQAVAVTELKKDDCVLLRPGDKIPCDGEIIEGQGDFDESILTGESAAVFRAQGEQVIAGAINLTSSVWIRVAAVGEHTWLSSIERMVRRAAREKPPLEQLADRVAAKFVAAVLLVCGLVSLVWWQIDPDRALWVALSVLVVTCPCALALATPTALAVATTNLRSQGLLLVKGHVLETLAKIDHILFDKTGTLSEGRPQIAEVKVFSAEKSKEDLLAIIAALELGVRHPIARAFEPFARADCVATDLQVVSAGGVVGRIGAAEYRFGSAKFAAVSDVNLPGWLWLVSEGEALAAVCLKDTLRKEANLLVSKLPQTLEIVSGDSEPRVAEIAHQLGIQKYKGDMQPQQKLQRVKELQAQGKTVLMVGDGVNDVPVLAAANVSLAMADASSLAQNRADGLLLKNDLLLVLAAKKIADRCKNVVRQNLLWALTYNLIALPMAASGMLPPWAAAIGMSASSLLVVLNAVRLRQQDNLPVYSN